MLTHNAQYISVDAGSPPVIPEHARTQRHLESTKPKSIEGTAFLTRVIPQRANSLI